MECRSLGEVREHIDAIDRRIVEALADRCRYVEQAARFKPTKHDVMATERTEEIVLKVRHAALEEATDPDLVEKVYRAMIDAFTLHEAKVWRDLHPEG